MAAEMTKWGVGPRLAWVGVPGMMLALIPRLLWPEAFTISGVPYWVEAVAAGVLILLGTWLHKSAGRAVLRAFEEKELCTDGAYAVCRHPVYASVLFFYLPALSLLLDTWSGLVAVAPGYVLVMAFVPGEDRYCRATFGERYAAYRRRTPALLPVGWLVPPSRPIIKRTTSVADPTGPRRPDNVADPTGPRKQGGSERGQTE